MSDSGLATQCRELLGAREASLRVVEPRLGLAQRLAGHDGAHAPQLVDACGGLIDGGLSLCDRGARFSVVDLHERVPGAHPLPFGYSHGDDQTGALRRDLHSRGHPDTSTGHDVLFDVEVDDERRSHARAARPERRIGAASEQRQQRHPQDGTG